MEELVAAMGDDAVGVVALAPGAVYKLTDAAWPAGAVQLRHRVLLLDGAAAQGGEEPPHLDVGALLRRVVVGDGALLHLRGLRLGNVLLNDMPFISFFEVQGGCRMLASHVTVAVGRPLGGGHPSRYHVCVFV